MLFEILLRDRSVSSCNEELYGTRCRDLGDGFSFIDVGNRWYFGSLLL